MLPDDIGIKKPREPYWLRGFGTSLDLLGVLFGGEEEDRTPDLRIANATLSQLSYPPNEVKVYHKHPNETQA